MLAQEERDYLLSFIERSQPGTAYRRRVRVLLLADEGMAPETIASELNIPINRVRQFLRVFNRERLDLFPESIILEPQPFSADDHIAEVGRQIMGMLAEKAGSHVVDLANECDVFSVHETRKTCRRMRTAFRLFEPYFEPGIMKRYRKRFRKVMKRLGRSRDIAVFLMKLDRLIDVPPVASGWKVEEKRSLDAFRSYWQFRQSEADQRVRDYMAEGDYQVLLKDLEGFSESEGEFVAIDEEPLLPTRAKYVIPVLIYEKVANVRAFENHIAGAPLKTYHLLRIRFKQLRYTLEFFAPILGPTIYESIAPTREMLTLLGDLNDARVALEMIDEVDEEDLATAAALYSQDRSSEIDALIGRFPPLWKTINARSWRRAISSAISSL